MSRVQIDTQAWGTVWDTFGNGLGGMTVQLKLAGTATTAAHYSAVTGGTTSTADLVTDASGLVKSPGSSNPRFIDAGTYDMTVDGVTRRVEAIPGSVGSRVDGFRSIQEFGSLSGTDATAMFDAAAASGERGIYVPYRDGGWNYDGILDISTEGAFWRGDKGGTTIYQRSIGRMLFDVAADDVTIQDLQLGYAPGEKATASWTYAEKDSGTNTLYNQDSTVSRSAMIYNYGGSRVTVRDVDFLNTYASIRMRSDDRYTTQAEDNRVLNCRFKDFEFGLLIMNQINPFVSGLFGRDTGSLGGAPPHLIYCAGGGAPPSGVPVSGINVTSVAATDIFTTDIDHGFIAGDPLQFSSLTGGAGLSTSTTYYVMDTPTLATNEFMLSATLGGATINHTTNVTAGLVASYLSDTVITGGLFANLTDYNNAYTSSFKFRNMRGTRINNVHAHGSRRGVELAYSSDVVVDGVSVTGLQRGLSQDTEIPGTDTLGAGLMVSLCADVKLRGVDIEMPTAEYNTGIRVESSADVEFFSPDVKATFGAGGNPAALYKTVGCSDVWFHSPGWEHNGTDSPAWRIYSSARTHIISPRVDSAFDADAILIVAGCTDTEVILDRNLIKPKKLAVADFLDDQGTNTIVRYVDTGVRVQQVQSTTATPKILTRDGKTLAADNCLWLPPSTVQRVTGEVVARDIATGDAAAWTIAMVFRRGSGSSNPVQIGTDTPTKLTSDAGAAAWSLAVGISNTQDAIYFEGTGAAAKTIEWRGRFVLTGEI